MYEQCKCEWVRGCAWERAEQFSTADGCMRCRRANAIAAADNTRWQQLVATHSCVNGRPIPGSHYHVTDRVRRNSSHELEAVQRTRCRAAGPRGTARNKLSKGWRGAGAGAGVGADTSKAAATREQGCRPMHLSALCVAASVAMHRAVKQLCKHPPRLPLRHRRWR